MIHIQKYVHIYVVDRIFSDHFPRMILVNAEAMCFPPFVGTSFAPKHRHLTEGSQGMMQGMQFSLDVDSFNMNRHLTFVYTCGAKTVRMIQRSEF